jgi:hypothetical protein
MESYEVRRNKIPEVMRSFEKIKKFAKIMRKCSLGHEIREEDMR